MTVLDVGQGDAILLEGPRGGRILVDGGPDPERLLLQLDARLPVWDRRIDVLLLTHPHEDHVGGLGLLLDRYRVGIVGEPGMRGPGPGYAAFAATLVEREIAHRLIGAGQRLRLDGARLDVRWPPRGTVPPEPADDGTGINNVSIVLDVRFGVRRFLLNGDVEQAVDPSLLATKAIGPVDVLKVAHHGSRTSSTAAFLAATRPRVAIVSAGAGNPYGHPAPETIERLRASGARVFRTDREGSVSVSTDGRDLQVSTSRARTSTGSTALLDRPLPQVERPVLAPLFACGMPAGSPSVPRIAEWPSRAVARRPPSSLDSIHRPGSSPTWPPSPRSPPSWLAA
jgi:competence protein ComEC